MKRRNPIFILAIAVLGAISSVISIFVTNNINLRICSIVLNLTAILFLYFQATFQGWLKNETGIGKGPWGHVLLMFVTFGIYMVYWPFAAGKRLAKMGAKDRSTVYFVINLVAVLVSVFFVVMIFYAEYNHRVIDKNLILTSRIIGVLTNLLAFAIIAHMQYVANNILFEKFKKMRSSPPWKQDGEMPWTPSV